MKGKNVLRGLLLMMMVLIMVGCDDDSVQRERIALSIEAQLPVYYELYSDSALLTEDDISFPNESLTLNSAVEVEKYLSKSFLQAYPEYTKIDFDRYSLLVFTSVQLGDIVGRKYNYYQEVATGRNIYAVTYLADRDEAEAEPTLYFERLGAVVPKLKPDVKVVCIRSVHISK